MQQFKLHESVRVTRVRKHILKSTTIKKNGVDLILKYKYTNEINDLCDVAVGQDRH